jgi:hypothetical protein
MRLVIVLTLAAASLFAEDKLEQYRNALTTAVTKADAALEAAKNERNAKVKRALKDYLNILQKAQVYWVKKGNLDRALEIRTEIRKVTNVLNPKPKPVFTLPPVNVSTTSDSEPGHRQPQANSYRGVVFEKKYRSAKDMLKAEKHRFDGWSSKQISAFKQAFTVWRTKQR